MAMLSLLLTLQLAVTPLQQNVLTPDEAKEGFKLMFDGKSAEGWRGFRRQSLPARWKVEEESLTPVPGAGRGGDITTNEEYGDFDFRIEWKIEAGGNSGIMYRASEEVSPAWYTGPEYQILDNTKHPDGKEPKTSAGSAYGIYAPKEEMSKPIGEWNATRIVATGKHIEHWLNGVKVVDYELESTDWLDRVSKSKFAPLPKYGRMPQGHIVLQDHGSRVSYRNIRIKKL
jgi:hypothetical protein